MNTRNSNPYVYTRIADIPPEIHGHIVAIGTFDGIHAGHGAVLTAAANAAMSTETAVLIFDPPARRYFAPDAPPKRLMNARLQNQELAAFGVKHIFRLPFDRQMREMSPEKFATTLLCKTLQVKAVAIGADFRFGKNRAGDAETMRLLGESLGFQTLIVDNVMAGAGKISSSRIRELVKAGEMKQAAEFLGRPYTLDGIIEKGAGLGRQFGWPTANMRVTEMLTPPFGIYAVRACTSKNPQWREGVAYHGCAPTLGKREPVFETHLFDFDSDLYGQILRVALYSWLRPDEKFPDEQSLRRQISQDAEQARKKLRAHEPMPPLLSTTDPQR